MGAFDGLTQFFDRPLSSYAEDFGYDQSNILILNGDIEGLESTCPDIYNNLLSCRHHSDRRTPIQYGRDLVASWVFEDMLFDQLQNDQFQLLHNGADRQRLILSRTHTAAASDYIVRTPGGINVPLELVNDYSNFWYKSHKLHLRDDKYPRLKRDHALLLAISVSTDIQKYRLFDFNNDVPASYIASHRPYGYKPAYELYVARDTLKDFSFANVIDSIADAIADRT